MIKSLSCQICLRLVAVVICFASVGLQFIQGQSLFTGIVMTQDSTPLIAVSIIESNTTNGTATNFEGEFSLQLMQDTSTIEVSYIGYETQIINASEEFVRIYLQPDTLNYISKCPIRIVSAQVSSAQNFSRIERQDLTINPAMNISEPLNFTPGVLMQSGTYGTSRLTMRGIGSRNQFGTAKILGYWNGIPITNTRGELAIDDLNLDFIDEVDVMRGPTSVQYGSALGGVLDMRTSMPRYSGLESRFSVGSNGLINQSYFANFSAMSNRLQGKLGFARFASDGWRQNSRYERNNINGHLTYTAGKLSNIIVSAFFFSADVYGEIPSSINADDFRTDPSLAAGNWLAVNGNEDYQSERLGLSVQYATVSNWVFKAAYSKYTFENDEVRPFNILYENQVGDAVRLKASKDELFIDNLRLEAGFELLSESRDWDTSIDSVITADFIDNGRNTMQFLNLRYRLFGSTEIQLGVSASQHLYELDNQFGSITSSNGRREYTNVSPSLKIKRSNQYNLSQYISIARGFSPPNSDEILSSDNTVNTTILPETGWTFEIGAKDYRNKWKYDITAFYMPTANLLVPQRISEEITIGVNAGKTRHFGLELVGYYDDLQTGPLTHNLTAMLSLSHNRFEDFVLDDIQFAGNEVTGIAPVTAAARWNGQFKGLDIRLDYQYRSRLPIDDANTIYADNYSLVNASLGYQLDFLEDDKFTIYSRVNVNNLLDQSYASMVLVNASSFGGNLPRYFYPGMPRNVVATLGVKYRFIP